MGPLVTIKAFEHYCTQPEKQCCGEIIGSLGVAFLVRKYDLLLDGKPYRMFPSESEARAFAEKKGFLIAS